MSLFLHKGNQGLDGLKDTRPLGSTWRCAASNDPLLTGVFRTCTQRLWHVLSVRPDVGQAVLDLG